MLIDAHCHLDRCEENLGYALQQIKQHRIFTISNSLDLLSYKENVKIATTSDFILPVFGIHPWNASEYVGALKDLEQAVSESPMIGEIGLDYYFVNETSLYDDQREVFEYLLRAASGQKKIVIVHTKGAEDETFQLLRQYNAERVIIHWYSGPWRILEAMVAHGFYFTIGVEVMFSQHIQDIARYLPSELMLTETDNPGGYKSITGTVGTPLLVKDVIEKLAEIRETSEETVAATVQNNLIRIGGNDSWLTRLPSSSS
jgi:TatD DNase family protein